MKRTTRPALQISVIGGRAERAEQLRAYAEYKLFSRLATHWRDVDRIDILVTAEEEAAGATCDITLQVGGSSVSTRTRRPHTVPAIDAAAEDLVSAVATKRRR